jgi:leucine dehydrogenase
MTALPRLELRSIEQNGFEKVVHCTDPASGLKSIISVHNTQLGPSLGGCRFYPYTSEPAALEDGTRLAQAMTYKASLAGLPLGGGKAVIIGNPMKDKSPALWKAYAAFVDSFQGSYITTVDSGTMSQDMDEIRKTTRYVVGMSKANGGSGDPSPTTALGVCEGVRAAAKFAFGSDDLAGKRIAIQGLGNVGFRLAQRLKDLGASLVVADSKPESVERAVKELGAEVVGIQEILSVKCDILAPCALGKTINSKSIAKLRTPVVAGAANNQLETEEDGELLHQKGVLYAPDFAINSGGLIHVESEWVGFDPKAVEKRTREIYDTMLKIFRASRDQNKSPSHVAIDIAKERLAAH